MYNCGIVNVKLCKCKCSTYTISWRGHRDRSSYTVELTSFLWHMPAAITETVAESQRKAATINQLACMPSYSLHVQLLWYPMYYSGWMKARVSSVQ